MKALKALKALKATQSTKPVKVSESVNSLNCLRFVGVDLHKLHKQTITLCVLDQSRKILCRERRRCADEAGIVRFFENLQQ